MAALKFAETHNLAAFLSKPKESDGFEQIIQALMDGKKVIITEASVKRDLQLANENGTECLPNATAFAELERMRFFANMKREEKGFSGRVTPLFQTMLVQAQEEGEGSVMPTVPQHTPTINQPSSSQPQKKQKPRKSKKQNTKVGGYARIESSEDKDLGDQEDASKQGRKIVDIDADEEVTLINETQGRNDDNLIFDTGVLNEQEFEVEKVVSTAKVTTASATTTTVDELTLAQTLIEIKAAKPKAVTTAATTTTTVVTRPKARGVIVQEPSEFTTTTSPSQSSQLPQAKDKGNAKIIEPEKPLKKKDQIMYDQEVALNLQAQLQAELEEEERLAMQREEDANIAEWDNVQAMIDADYELAARLQAQEQEELTIEERSKMFVELMDKKKKHFARLRAEEQRRKPPTKAQKRSQISTYLKHMAGYKHNQQKSKNYDEI
ncbi:hypothetical protein Tco_0265077 [Tanacetum coccineum]